MKGRTQEYVTYLMLSRRTTTNTREMDFEERAPPSLTSRGSRSTLTTIDGGSVVVLFAGELAGRGIAWGLGWRALLFFVLEMREELVAAVAETTPPAAAALATSKLKTSVHIPELKIGPEIKVNCERRSQLRLEENLDAQEG